MPSNRELATVNAVLVSVSTICMALAFRAVRHKQITAHRNLMLAAFGASGLFMVLFVLRFVRYGPTPFAGGGALRGLFYAVYFSHEPVAVISVPLVVTALILGLRRSFPMHREVARMALPVWLYSSVTGVGAYLLLYVVSKGTP